MIILRKFYAVLTFIGIDPLRLFQHISGLGWFWRDYRTFKKLAGPNSIFPINSFYPLLNDKKESSGSVKGHYFHQDLLVAQRIFANAPIRHVDIGSRIDGFIAHVAAFRQVEVFDIRPLPDKIDNVRFTQADLMHIEGQKLDVFLAELVF